MDFFHIPSYVHLQTEMPLYLAISNTEAVSLLLFTFSNPAVLFVK